MVSHSTATRRVLVIDDSAAYRQVVTRVLERIDQISVLGAVGTLALAQARIERGDVDAVTLDIVLRGESGLDLLRWVRTHHPHLLVVLLSGDDSYSNVEALLLGATLVVKPTGADAEQRLTTALKRELLGGAGRSARSPVQHAVDARGGAVVEPATGRNLAGLARRELIAVGASTGGPPILLHFLQTLPPAFEVPIVIVQHMPAAHIGYFVEMLEQQSRRAVRLAKHGMPIEPGVTYIAGDGKHMLVARQNGRLVTLQDDGPAEHYCKPAVDPLFRSVAATCGPTVVGVVTTGMGSDGALGAVALRARGAPVVVQDQATSVVWGMPGAVVAARAADAVVPGLALAGSVIAWTSGLKPRDEETRR